MVHRLKIRAIHLYDIRRCVKLVGVRKNDRNFQIADVIEFTNLDGELTGDRVYISHVLDFPDGIRDGYVVLSIRVIGQPLPLEEMWDHYPASDRPTF